jgi:hypothetical protein
MIAIKSSVLKVWDMLLCEGNRNMFFRIGLSLMEIHGRVGRLVSEHLRSGLFVIFARGPHFFFNGVQRVDAAHFLPHLAH